jgi:hypothetical protein
MTRESRRIAEHRGLARAVGADQAHQLAGLDGEVHLVHGRDAEEALDEAANAIWRRSSTTSSCRRGVYIAVWDGALKNYGPNLGYDMPAGTRSTMFHSASSRTTRLTKA